MSCENCEERRQKMIDAVLEGKLAAAAGHAVKGAAEMIGIKPKTAVSEKKATQTSKAK